MPKKATKHAPGEWRGDKFHVRMRRRKGENGLMRVSFSTQREADEWYFNAALPVYESGREVKRPTDRDQTAVAAPAPKRVRFAEGSDLWWKFYLRESGRDVTPDTHEAHQRTINEHLLPRFATMWADEITDDDVAQLRDDLWEQGYRKGSARAILTTLTMIFKHLHARGLTPGNPAAGIIAREPKKALHSVTKFSGMVSLADCENIADLMPRHMRAALWVQRLAGLRVAEVFGLRVEHILFDQSFVQVRAQGGKRIRVRDAEGNIQVAHFVDDLKTEAGRRDVAMCETLRSILTDHIAEFCDGGRDPSMHLFNEGAPQNRCTNYNETLGRASKRVGVVGDNGGGMTSHVLRKSFSTDLSHGNILGLLWSRTMGHAVRAFDGGAEVTADRYTLTPTQERLGEVARLMDRLVEEACVDVSLESGVEHDPSEYVTYQTAAALLGLNGASDVGRLVRSGHLHPFTGRTTVERPRRYIAAAELLGLREQVATEVSSEDVRTRFGLTLMQLQRMKAELGIVTRPSILNGLVHVWTSEQVAQVEHLLEARQERHAEAMPISEAARRLGMNPDTASTLVKAGHLTRLPDMRGVVRGAVTWITRESVDAYIERYGSGPLGANLSSKTYVRDAAPKGCMSYREAAEVLGVSKNSRISSFVAEGRLTAQVAPGRKGSFVTIASVEALLAERTAAGIVAAAAEPKGYMSLRRAAERMGVGVATLRRNMKAWGLTVETVKVNGADVEALSIEAVETVGVPAAARWAARPKYGTEKYRPDASYMSVAEVAEATGVAVNTARWRIAKGEYAGAVSISGQGREWKFVPRESVLVASALPTSHLLVCPHLS